MIIREEKKSIAAIFKESGEVGFRTKEKQYLHAIDFGDKPFGLVTTGGGTPAWYDNADYMLSQGTMVWLSTPVEIIAARLREEQEHRPMLRDVPADELISQVRKLYEQREPYYARSAYRIDNAGYDYEAVNELKEIINRIRGMHPQE